MTAAAGSVLGAGQAALEVGDAVKREFDPPNVFHLNHNIDPS